MELSILTQLTVSNELLITQTPFVSFIDNIYSFLSMMHLISIRLIFLKLDKYCLYLYLRKTFIRFQKI